MAKAFIIEIEPGQYKKPSETVKYGTGDLVQAKHYKTRAIAEGIIKAANNRRYGYKYPGAIVREINIELVP